MADLLAIGLSGWIIADGNYRDFNVGDVRSFALEYYNEAELRTTSNQSCTNRHLGYAKYAVNGRRLHLTDTWCAIDVGVLAYREAHGFMVPPEWFSGEIYIGVDPFPYFERLGREPDAPALAYDWKVHRIEVETAPRILQGGMWVFDPERRRLEDVATTGGGDEMILHCELLSDAPAKGLIYQ